MFTKNMAAGDDKCPTKNMAAGDDSHVWVEYRKPLLRNLRFFVKTLFVKEFLVCFY